MIELLKHTADIEIKVLAPALGILFKDNLGIMNDILKKGGCDAVDHYDCLMDLEVDAADTTNLLVVFLSDILSLSYVQKTLFCNVYLSELSEHKLSARLYGKWIDGFDEEIKAVTAHGAFAGMNSKGMWESHIIFDI